MTVGILQQNLGPNLGYGYYPGDFAFSSHGRESKKRTEPIVINALDLKRLTQRLESGGLEEKMRHIQKNDRETRHNLSKARVARWDNTIAGQRRKRLQAREARLAAEEAERVQLDEEYAIEEEERRKQIIDRAKKLQFYETDLVKTFHSKVMLFEALKERDMQMALKKERQAKERQEELESHKEDETAARHAELHAMIEKRRRALQTQQDLLEQLDEKKAREAIEKEEERKEAAHYAAMGAEFAATKKAEVKNQKAQRAQWREQLIGLSKELANRNEANRQLDIQETQRAKEWTERKRQQVMKKKQLEKQWADKARNTREIIGEQNRKTGAEIDAKIDAAVAKAMHDREEREIRQMKETAEKMRKQGEDLAASYQEHVERTRAEQLIQQEEDAKTLREYRQMQEELIAAKKARQEESRRKGKELQDHHLRDMALHDALRIHSRNSQLAEDARMVASQRDEVGDLHAYMRSLASESWAADNSRLQTYVQQETTKPRDVRGFRLANKYQALDTGSRLGLVNVRSAADFAGTNEICKGDLLGIVGRSTSRARSPPSTAVKVVRPTGEVVGPASRPQSSSTLLPKDSLPALPAKALKH